MESIWLGVWPNARTTRVLAMRGASETILKARLPLRPSSGKAVTSLLEAVALWEGRQVRAVLVADDASTRSSTTLYQETFDLFGEQTALWQLEWVSRVRARRRRRDELGGVGDFADLERLLIHSVAR